MFLLLRKVISEFESRVGVMNTTRTFGPFAPLKVTILGQQALLIRQDQLKHLHLLATTDFDGLLNGETPLEDLFKIILKNEGMKYGR